jgi:uncharacterized damage-inducible protein DinB
MPRLIADLTHEFHRHKELADRAMADLPDEAFFHRPADQVNPVGLIVKHLAGNLSSRWSDFLTTDGDKPTRDRDSEFYLTPADTRQSLMARWEAGWATLFATLGQLTDADLGKSITIRGEPHKVQQALLRGATHAAYHIGQILYLARLLNPGGSWLTIPPGQSQKVGGAYLK